MVAFNCPLSIVIIIWQYSIVCESCLFYLPVCEGAVFLVTFALLGLNLWGAAIVIGVVGMIIVHMLGVMALLGINANAVSLVNLVMVSV